MFKTLALPPKSMLDPLLTAAPTSIDPAARKQKVADQMTLRLAMLQQARAQRQLLSAVHLMDNQRSDYADMRQFHRVVRHAGLSRALMQFVNPHNQLAAIIPGLPATESLDSVTIQRTDPRTLATLEGFETALEQHATMVADWIQTGADNLDVLLESLKPQTADLGEAISHYLEELEAAEIDDADLSQCTAVLLPHDDICARIACLLEAFPDFDAAVSDPTDRDAMDAHAQAISETADKMGSHTGLAVDSDNPHQLTMDRTDATAPQQGNLAELGYDLPKTVALLKMADALLDEVEGLIARKAAMLDQLDAAKTMVSGLDNAVPPATDDAIPADEADDMTAGNTTQCDMVHAQVSSHMVHIAAAVECAISTVQDVLTVAQMLDELDDADDDDPAASDAPAPNEPDV